ncbi:MAG: TetR/AcrR family transcriptional regulator, partial [Ktedonobacterales bacterium]
VGQITQEADLGLGTFYLHFATKDDIFRAVLVEGFGELSQRLETTRRAASERHVPWWGVVRLLIAAYYAFAAEHRELFAVMCASGGADMGVGRELEEQFTRDVAEQMLSIQHDRATGATMYPYPTQPVASALVSALNRAVLWWMAAGEADGARSDERQSLEALIDTMSRFITAALGGRLPTES